MVIVRLMGGLGNQMFQYAFARSISLERNCELFLDTSLLESAKIRNSNRLSHRNFDLDIFQNPIRFIDTIPDSYGDKEVFLVEERRFKYDHRLIEELRNVPIDAIIVLQGYWQSPKYFQHNLKRIRAEFRFKNQLYGRRKVLGKKIDSSVSVMVNVRRGDYLKKLDYHGVVSRKYLKESMGIMTKTLLGPKFYIFSDDIPWCRENIPDDKTVFFVDESYYDEKYQYYLQLMIKCKHFIISNSSYAWWAAFMGQAPNSIVIAPCPWLHTALETIDLIPEKWKLVNID